MLPADIMNDQEKEFEKPLPAAAPVSNAELPNNSAQSAATQDDD